ncbi:VWA domain-containing protein [Stigmatella sp. ncwal1]|uniref:VWA domain-containing protein n=1 Tax=Stigmatella ashevillensis TaxID=2995309 RepID=A0ABT5DCD6_9BACT|nr:VWA domain-containing protein [Stigmatella ashevillena]MDC0711296.1 VWA domain-containing protein [Stigmatella ashevillena]
MGYGSYSYEAHEAMTQARQNLPQQEVFRQRECHPKMNPHGVRLRESRDSEAHPNSLAIVFALDVSGSMGEIPDMLARKHLPSFMKNLLEAGVADPQVLFMAIGNAYADRAPLQVGQFESSEQQMDQWLTRMYLEGGGGGLGETYELAMYFAAEHTAMDCLEKRQKKGYLLMTGDEPAFDKASKAHIQQVIGDVIPEDLPVKQVFQRLEQSFEMFFLIPDGKRRQYEDFWRYHLGDRVICMDAPEDTCTVAAGIVALREGAVSSVEALTERLRQQNTPAARIRGVINALTPWAQKLPGAANR